MRFEIAHIQFTMGTHNLHFRGYNPYIGGLKPSFFMVLGSKGSRYLFVFFCNSRFLNWLLMLLQWWKEPCQCRSISEYTKLKYLNPSTSQIASFETWSPENHASKWMCPQDDKVLAMVIWCYLIMRRVHPSLFGPPCIGKLVESSFNIPSQEPSSGPPWERLIFL